MPQTPKCHTHTHSPVLRLPCGSFTPLTLGALIYSCIYIHIIYMYTYIYIHTYIHTYVNTYVTRHIHIYNTYTFRRATRQQDPHTHTPQRPHPHPRPRPRPRPRKRKRVFCSKLTQSSSSNMRRRIHECHMRRRIHASTEADPVIIVEHEDVGPCRSSAPRASNVVEYLLPLSKRLGVRDTHRCHLALLGPLHLL